jgi:hypothetical protein
VSACTAPVAQRAAGNSSLGQLGQLGHGPLIGWELAGEGQATTAATAATSTAIRSRFGPSSALTLPRQPCHICRIAMFKGEEEEVRSTVSARRRAARREAADLFGPWMEVEAEDYNIQKEPNSISISNDASMNSSISISISTSSSIGISIRTPPTTSRPIFRTRRASARTSSA